MCWRGQSRTCSWIQITAQPQSTPDREGKPSPRFSPCTCKSSASMLGFLCSSMCDSPAGYFGFLTNLFCRCARLSSSAICSKVCTSFTLPYRLLSVYAYPANLPLVYSRLSSALLQPPFVSPVPGEPNAKPPSLKEQIVLVSAAARAPLPGMAAADVVQAAALLQHTFISGAFGGRNGFSSSPRPVLCAVYLLTPRGVEHHISKAGHTGV